MDELKKLRDNIDEIDKNLVKLFEKRMKTVLKVGRYKKENNIPILNSNRESEVIKKNLEYLNNKKYEMSTKQFLNSMMDISKKFQAAEITKTNYYVNDNKNIVLIGMPGSGKTTIGKLLGKRLGIKWVCIDQYIQKKEKKTIMEIFKDGEAIFREIEREAVKKISTNSSMVISTGGGVVTSDINIKNLKKNGVIIYLNRSIENIISDIDISARPLLKNNIEKLNTLYQQRYDLYKNYNDYEIKNDSTLDVIIDRIINVLETNNIIHQFPS